jgi:hypothetical protein
MSNAELVRRFAALPISASQPVPATSASRETTSACISMGALGLCSGEPTSMPKTSA